MTKISRCGVWIFLYKCPSSNCEENKVVLERFVEWWMDLQSVIQSEISQKEKNKYRILTHMCYL